MAKEKVRRINGVIASVFSHTGYISKEDAQEISGLDDSEFNKVYAKAAEISRKIIRAEGNKVDAFIEHIAREIDAYTAHYGGKLFK
jgi:hypothetical protein